VKKAISKKQLEQIIGTFHDGIIVTNRHGRIAFANTAAEKILGLNKSDIVGRNFKDLFPFSRIVGANTPLYGIEQVHERPEGARAVVSINATPFYGSANTAERVVLSLRDVTELKQAEEELKFKSLLLDSALDSIIVHDLEGRMLYINEAAFKTRGYTKEELMSMPLQKLVAPEYAESVKPVMDSLLKTGSAIYESVHLKKDGTVMPVEVDARVVEFEGRKLIINIVRDITELKQAEEALAASEKELRNITSVLGEGVYKVDEKGRLAFMNPEAEHLLGWTEKELLNKDMHEAIHYQRADGTRLPVEACPIRRVVDAGISYRTEDDVFIRKDGSTFPVAYVSTPIIEDRRVVGSVTAFQDITEHKRIEEALKRSEAGLAEAQHVAHLGSWDWDLQTNELLWSDEIYHIFGTSPEEFGVSYEAYLSFVHPDDIELVKRSVDEALHEGKPYSIDHRIVLSDGTERIVHAQAEVVLDKAGKPIRMVGTIQDITERKRVEEILEKRRQLEKQVYADAMAAVTGGQFMLSSHEEIRQYAQGVPVLSQFVTRPEEIYPFRAFIDAFLANRGLTVSRRYEIEFAVVEALTNSVKHAGGGRLEIRTDNVLQIEIADNGPGINFAMLPRSVLMLGFSTKGTLGFGFTIMLEFADRLYLATGPAGTTIILEFQWTMSTQK